jgi:nitrogenase subunit NifH
MERKRRRIRMEEVINKRKFITDPKQIINQLHKRKGANKVALAREERLIQEDKHKQIMEILSTRPDLNNDYAEASKIFKQNEEVIKKLMKDREIDKKWKSFRDKEELKTSINQH